MIPYGKLELEKICLKAYSSSAIQKYCVEWKENQDVDIDSKDKVREVIKDLKIEFPRL